MARIVGISILTLVVVSGLDIGEASGKGVAEAIDALACERIFEYFTYCMEFLVAAPDHETPPRRCCTHIEKLNILAHHRTGPRRLCQCIELMVKGVAPPIVSDRVTALPIMCNTHLSFPISDSMDCSTIGQGT
ncbi:non-specific lipid-transfer protein 13-like [Neltuma alba]|uniref:non-specific lipid-transfer protein 13-like n=1 Tax=Neltuma alba TaxID=207710 RepID=UPI0010A33B1E|nr:non-specific lipid-transfer protein 13-like [Prosopis alba]XP_028761662.1 non-specific lipid-transfer protein 13-like [Prosopis alba]XP_028787572.1 non-specific lipid-transfer protein 13-like [Prosopis alba]